MSFRKSFRAVPLKEGAYYAAKRRKRRRQRNALQVLIGAVLAAAVGLGSQLLPSDRDDSAGKQPSDMSAVADTAPYVQQPIMSAPELDAQQPSASNAHPSVSARAIAPVAASGGWYASGEGR